MDAAYCYGRRSAVCRSVCLSVTTVSRAKAAEPIVMPFRMLTRVVPMNHVLDGGPDPHVKDNFEGDGVTSGFSHADQRSDWPAADAVECHNEFTQ